MELPLSLSRLSACVAFAGLLVGAGLPLAMTGPGEWEIGKSASGRGERMCLPDPALLMQWEHRARQCTRTIVNPMLDRAEVHYTCAGGDFGTSRVQVLTPRAIKVDIQGIADGLPFAYAIYARRIGNCPNAASSAR